MNHILSPNFVVLALIVTEILAFIQTKGHANSTKSHLLLMLIKNKYFVRSKTPSTASHIYSSLVTKPEYPSPPCVAGINIAKWNDGREHEKRVNAASRCLVGCLPRCCLFAWLFALFAVVRLLFGLGLRVGAKFSSRWFLCFASQQSWTFFGAVFSQSECGPQAETPNTSHIWIYVMPLIGCCADAMAWPTVPCRQTPGTPSRYLGKPSLWPSRHPLAAKSSLGAAKD